MYVHMKPPHRGSFVHTYAHFSLFFPYRYGGGASWSPYGLHKAPKGSVFCKASTTGFVCTCTHFGLFPADIGGDLWGPYTDGTLRRPFGFVHLYIYAYTHYDLFIYRYGGVASQILFTEKLFKTPRGLYTYTYIDMHTLVFFVLQIQWGTSQSPHTEGIHWWGSPLLPEQFFFVSTIP